jgi:hypothetical protein
MSDYGTPPPPPPPAPGYDQGPVVSPPPPNYLVWAILSTIFCCLPFGVASIVFAAQVNGKWQAGDYAGAKDSSDKARRFAIWAAIAGVVVDVIYIIFVLVLGGMKTNS